MSSYDAERLYALLPSIYRRRDAEAGHPLKALVGILARQAQVVERDIERLYENAFIETCADWVVPYIGDLVGVRPLPAGGLRRDEVANTLGLRRRKGTAGMLEQLAADVTGWPARVVEAFRHLAASQYLDHPRPGRGGTADLRDPMRLERAGGPFDELARTADAGRAATGEGRYNTVHVALWLWRLEAYPQHLVEPFPVDEAQGHYTFHPLGIDVPLYHHPLSETATAQLAEEVHVPEPIRLRQLAADLAQNAGRYYGAGRSLAVYELGQGEWRPVEGEVVACDLSDWNRPLPGEVVAVDPERGRLRFTTAERPDRLRVSFHQGFGGEIGGGPYPRELEASDTEAHVAVGDPDDPRLEGPLVATLADALAGLGELWEGETRVVEIRDSRTYAETLDPLVVPANARLVIRAADQERPTLLLGAPLAIDAQDGSALALDGLLIAGAPVEIDGELDRLAISHTTLVPAYDLAAGAARAAADAPSLVVRSNTMEGRIRHTVTGPLWIAPEAEVTLADSIVDAGAATGGAYAGPDGTGSGGAFRASRVTVIGAVAARAVPLAESSLLLGEATAERRQEGCVRYTWVAEGSRVPRRFRCLPPPAGAVSAADRARLVASLTPRFLSLRYGRPDYGQLDLRGRARSGDRVSAGAADGSEMGAFSALGRPQRVAGLKQRLHEYLPVDLEAGVFFAS